MTELKGILDSYGPLAAALFVVLFGGSRVAAWLRPWLDKWIEARIEFIRKLTRESEERSLQAHVQTEALKEIAESTREYLPRLATIETKLDHHQQFAEKVAEKLGQKQG